MKREEKAAKEHKMEKEETRRRMGATGSRMWRKERAGSHTEEKENGKWHGEAKKKIH